MKIHKISALFGISVASVRVKEINGAAPGTFATITTARFCTQDSNNPGTNNPIPIPTTGFRNSYRKAFILAFGGTFTQINNINIYTDGGDFGTGIKTYIGSVNVAEGVFRGSYAIAKGQVGVAGSAMSYGSASTKIYGSSGFFGYTSGAKKLVQSANISAVGTMLRWVPLQLAVGSNASQGALSAETITFSFDEI